MSTCPTLEDLALWLDDPGVEAVGTHVAGCASCGMLIEELKGDQALLQSTLVLPEAAYATVRGRVLRELRPKKLSKFAWMGVAAAAAVLLAAFLPIRRAERPQVAQAPVAARAREVKQTPVQPAFTKSQIKPRRTAPPAPVSSSSAGLLAALDGLYADEPSPAIGSPGQVVITMETQDPNVTIILLGESTGDEE